MIYNAYQDTNVGIGGLSVVSSGHIFAKKGRKIDRPSGRSDYLLFYVARGKELFSLQRDVVAEEGSFIFFRPFEKQEHVYIDDKTGEFYFVHFNAPPDFDLFGFESSRVYHSTLSSTVSTLFEEIISELQRKQPAYEKFCAAKVYTIMSVLERKAKKESPLYGMYSDKISFVIQKMNKEYQKDYGLEDWGKMCNLSKYHFLRIFKSITGVSPLEYRNNIRLEHVREQIEETDAPISEIGESAGFSSPAYFCQAFKKRFGVSPSEYRKKN